MSNLWGLYNLSIARWNPASTFLDGMVSRLLLSVSLASEEPSWRWIYLFVASCGHILLMLWRDLFTAAELEMDEKVHLHGCRHLICRKRSWWRSSVSLGVYFTICMGPRAISRAVLVPPSHHHPAFWKSAWSDAAHRVRLSCRLRRSVGGDFRLDVFSACPHKTSQLGSTALLFQKFPGMLIYRMPVENNWSSIRMSLSLGTGARWGCYCNFGMGTELASKQEERGTVMN